jgi:AcrR family transcriptional regulator
VGYKHSRDEILGVALDAALEEGLSQLTFGRLSKRMGISDRTIVYYFASKDDLIAAVLSTLGSRLREGLAGAFTEPAEDHLALVRTAWPKLARRELDPVFGLFFELTGLAAAGREPYASLGVELLTGWSKWLEQFFAGAAARRRAEAEATLAMVDGLLLLRQLGGPAAANRAAKAIGVA